MNNIYLYAGSNSIIKYSYSKIISKKYNLIHHGLGSTTTNRGIIELSNDKNHIKENDIIIHEYYINDHNEANKNIINWNTILKDLEEFINLCKNYKLFFILIHTVDTIKNLKYITEYTNIIKKYNCSFLDTKIFIKRKCTRNMLKKIYYGNPGGNFFNHPNKSFHEEIAKYFLDNINNIKKININNKFIFTKYFQYYPEKTTNFTNRLVNTNFLQITNEYSFNIQKKYIKYIEFLCDKNTGIIQITADNTKKYYFCALKQEEDFLFNRNKKLLTIINIKKPIFIQNNIKINIINNFNKEIIDNLNSYHPHTQLLPKNNINTNFNLVKIIFY